MKIVDFFLPKKKIFNILFYILIGSVTLFLSLGILRIRTNNDITELLPINKETQADREKTKRLGEEFSSSQPMFIGITKDPFSEKKIKRLWELCNELDKLEVVKSSLSPFNATYFKIIGPTFIPKKMKLSKYPKNQKQIDSFLKNITSNRYLVGSVISYDKKTAGIILRMNQDAVPENGKHKNTFVKISENIFGKSSSKQITRSYFCQEVENVLKKYDNDFKIYFAGVPVYEAKSKQYMSRDIVVLIVPVFMIMIFILFISFKSFRGTILPIISISLSTVWTMGVIGWLGYKLDTIGILIPPLIMTVGSSYTLHYLNAYFIDSQLYKNSRDLVINSTKQVFPTILTASITTMVGFASFLVARIIPIRNFGIFIIASIFFTLFFTFFMLSKILSVFKIPKFKRIKNVRNDFFSKFLNFSRELVIPFRFVWIGIFVLCIVLFLLFINRISAESSGANLFKRTDEVRQSLVFLQKNFKGTSQFNITLRAKEGTQYFFKTREGILAAKKIQEYFDSDIKIDNFQMIGWILSPITLLEDLNMVLEGKKGIPDEKTIKTFLGLLKASKDDGIDSIINDDFSAITFQIRPHTNDIKKDCIMTEKQLNKLIKKVNRDIDHIAKSNGSYTAETWGEILLIGKISKFIVKDQIISLTITALLVFLITLIIFKSPYFAIMSLIPLSFGVIMNFTIMSILEIPLDVATVMIAAISIGIGTDDAVHFLLHYKKFLNKSDNPKDAVLQTLTFTARPIFFTSIVLIAGFLVFLLSSFRPVKFFGILIAISMFNCTFATLFILPSFLLISDNIRKFIHRGIMRKKSV